MIRKVFILTFLLTVSLFKTFATSQIPDRLIYHGDTLSIFANPLEQLFDNDSIRPNFFGQNEGCESTACWRGYEAEWRIIDDSLYLTGIYSCCYYEDRIKADLKELFGVKFINGKVKADWFTADIIAPQGQLLYYIHMGYESLYEKELVFKFKNGKLAETEIFDNSKSRQSDYSQNDNLRLEYIYKNIRWEKLPNLVNDTIKVWVKFSANENGVIDDVKIMRGNSKVFNKEAIRVIKSIPNWDIYYRHGKFERTFWNQPIIFSESNSKNYNNKTE